MERNKKQKIYLMGNSCSDGSSSGQQKNGKKGLNLKKPVHECKVVILGERAVGKTSIAYRYLEDKFSDAHIVTLGVNFVQPEVKLDNGTTVKINLWDTAGEERFRSMLPMYYKSSKAAIFTYDVGNALSFQNIEDWVSELNDHVNADDIILYLVGNKKDLPPEQRKVSTEEGQKTAERLGMRFMEVSAKTGDGVPELFKTVAEEFVKKFKP